MVNGCSRYHIAIILASLFFIISACSSWRSNIEFYDDISTDLATGDFVHAEQIIEHSRETEEYLEKDRVLYYLDKAILGHYQQDYSGSNEYFEQAELTMEDLFTSSISKGVSSVLINDNVLEYSGEIYENIYVNIFKALNYLHLDQFDEAYVEIRRVNEKLVVLDDKYGEMIEEMNRSDSMKVKIKKKALRFYDDILAHYLSYLVFRAEGEFDNSRISFEKIHEAQNAQSDVYDYALPSHITSGMTQNMELLNVIAFTGKAAVKEAAGGKITTYDNHVHISDLTYQEYNQILPLPGIDDGYHFKFSFPVVKEQSTAISTIEILADGESIGTLELLEDMGKIATSSFETKKDIIFFKTVSRSIIKGLASKKVKDKLQKEADVEDNFILKSLLNFGVDMVVDATENPDLRCWRTMPGKCFIGEFELSEGEHTIEIRYYNQDHILIKNQQFPGLVIGYGKLNLLESICLN
jgi:hypothetical protein